MPIDYNYYIPLDDIRFGNPNTVNELQELFRSTVGEGHIPQKFEGLSRWITDKGNIITRLCVVNFFTGDVMVKDL